MVEANKDTPPKTFFLTTFICFSGCLNSYIDTAVSAVKYASEFSGSCSEGMIIYSCVT